MKKYQTDIAGQVWQKPLPFDPKTETLWVYQENGLLCYTVRGDYDFFRPDRPPQCITLWDLLHLDSRGSADHRYEELSRLRDEVGAALKYSSGGPTALKYSQDAQGYFFTVLKNARIDSGKYVKKNPLFDPHDGECPLKSMVNPPLANRGPHDDSSIFRFLWANRLSKLAKSYYCDCNTTGYQVLQWIADDLSEKDMAKQCGVDVRTIRRWKRDLIKYLKTQ